MNPAARRRNAILHGVELFRATAPATNLTGILIFLYVCENPGVSVQSLADLLGLSAATASRSARALLAHGADGALPPYADLLVLVGDVADRRGREFYLSSRGVQLRGRLNEAIERAVQIDESSQGPIARL